MSRGGQLDVLDDLLGSSSSMSMLESTSEIEEAEKAALDVFQEHSLAYGSTTPSLAGASTFNLNPPGHNMNAIAAATIPGSVTQSASTLHVFAPTKVSYSHDQVAGDMILQNEMQQAASMMRAAILFGASTLRPVQPTAAEKNIAAESSRTPLKRGRNMRISKDPQSVAARNRRERISDRICVLRRLVPGGTKMDTASMLDEAIQYVKFLKLQLQPLMNYGFFADTGATGIQGLCDDLRYDSGAAIGGSQSSTVVPEDLRAVQPFDLNSCTQVCNQGPNSSCEEPGTALDATCVSPTVAASSSHMSSQGVRWPQGASSSASSMRSPFGGPAPGQIPDPLQEQFCH
ncbi:unnamed protein product [Sphagnum jensenii]|uniref:BHLH domain-containing protein n=1 Tax=Sphagnum jensenii TaxID=128206 RepID=A0ABP0W2N7_9BRYO